MGSDNPSEGLAEWQRWARPLMWTCVGVFSLFFLVVTLFQVTTLQEQMLEGPWLDETRITETVWKNAENISEEERLRLVHWETLALLDTFISERRYHQATAALMARTWLAYLGFLTGMILALVGATFILGKLRVEGSKLDVDVANLVKTTLATTSPGIVLAVLGVSMMITTILTHRHITIEDAPVFTQLWPKALAAEALVAGEKKDPVHLTFEDENDPLFPCAGLPVQNDKGADP